MIVSITGILTGGGLFWVGRGVGTWGCGVAVPLGSVRVLL